MGVITVSGLPQTNVIQYNVTMDAPSLDPTSSSGGTGAMSYVTDKDVNATALRATGVTISDKSYGKVSGTITNITQDSLIQTVSADTVLSVFNADLTIPPFVGTLSNGLAAFFNLTRAAAMGVQYLPVLGGVAGSTTQVVFPGAKGNAWQYLKQLCQKYKLYPSIGTDGVTVNFPSNLPSTLIDDRQLISESWSIDDNQVGRAVEVAYYDNKAITSTTNEVFPIRGDYNGASIIQVGPGEVVVTDIQLSAWVSSVNQPTCVDFVGPTDQSNTNGRYCVAGSDGLPIMAAQWTAQGGQLKVDLTPDPSVVRVTVTAPRATSLLGSDAVTARFAPYSIAATSGNLYNSLHITGAGVKFNRNTIQIQTGCTLARTGDDVAFTCDSPFTGTLGDAYDIGLRAAQAYAGPAFTINRTERGAATTAMGTWLSRKIVKPDVTFTLESVTFSADSVQETGIAYTQIADFNTVWSGQTFAQFNTNRGTIKFMEFAVTPLRRNS